MRTLALFIGLFFTPLSYLFAQERCGTSAYLQKNQSGSYGTRSNALSDKAKAPSANITEQQGKAPVLPDQITIPVVIHILYRTSQENITDDQVFSQLESLNADFRRSNADMVNVPAIFSGKAGKADIRFELAKTDPDGRATTGIIRKKTSVQLWTDDDKIKFDRHTGSSAWDTRSYLNIWVGNTVGGLLGYASFPGGPADKDGIVIRYDVFGTRGRLTAPFNKGRTLTHEAGHWLNLKHLWGDISCGDDGIDDTPRQRSNNRGCPVFPRINTGCDNGPAGDMFMNFMDFTDDACMHMFTTGQAELMRSEFATGGNRSSFLESKGLSPSWNFSQSPALNSPEAGSIRIYPNPARDMIQLVTPPDFSLTGQIFAILNPAGQVLMTGKIIQQNQAISIRNLSSGLYFIRIENRLYKWIKSAN